MKGPCFIFLISLAISLIYVILHLADNHQKEYIIYLNEDHSNDSYYDKKIFKFDLFKRGKPIYEVIRNVQDCDIIANNGIRELYVNLTSKEVKETKLNDLFNMVTKEYAAKKLSMTEEEFLKLIK